MTLRFRCIEKCCLRLLVRVYVVRPPWVVVVCARGPGPLTGSAKNALRIGVFSCPADEGLLEPQLAAKLMQQAGDLYAKSTASKDGQFFSQAALSAAKLLRAQLQLEAESPRRAGEAYQGLSVADTIAKCVVSGNTKAANALKNDFKVSDKHFCWIRLRALAAKRDWEGVVALAEEKKPPIGCAFILLFCGRRA